MRGTARIAALLAPLLATCGASWTGTYEGSVGADAYRLVVTQNGSALEADAYRISLGAQAPCRLEADPCAAALAPDGRSFSASACTLRLAGHAGGCTGEIAFDLEASEGVTNGAFVTELVVETTLDDLPVALLRVPTQCSDGIDNDSDGRIDHPADPQCADAHGDREAIAVTWSCGLGGELALLVPALAWARRRTRRGAF